MKLTELSPPLYQMLGVMATYAHLGFPEAQTQVVLAKAKDDLGWLHVYAQVTDELGHDFKVDCGRMCRWHKRHLVDTEADARLAQAAWNVADQGERDLCYRNCMAVRDAYSFVLALMKKGIRIPRRAS